MQAQGRIVLVTGGSGYIAGETIRQLLARGWTVHTTVRSLSREAELRQVLGGTPATLRFFRADLTSDAGWAGAAAGCSHVCHMASPFPPDVPRDENELIVPARDGALRALKAAQANGVKHFVLASSAAAIAYGHPPGKTRYDERDWTDVSAPGVQPYVKSKTIAERAARDWVAENAPDMAFCTINPVAVLGPVASKDFAASVGVFEQLLSGKVPACPDVGFCLVDVRDVADLHVRALEADPATIHGERFIGSSGPFYRIVDLARMLRQRLGDQARKVPTQVMPNWLVRVMAVFMPSLRQLLGELGRTRAMSSAHAQHVLAWTPRPPEETAVDCARSLIERGIVKV